VYTTHEANTMAVLPTHCADKTVPLTGSTGSTAQVYHEANIMAMLPQHPNVVRYFGTVLQKPHCALVLELWCAPAREPERHPYP
jgi:hypothetical protein